MKSFLAIIGMLLAFVLALFILGLLIELYYWFRRKINKPCIGYENFNGKSIKRGDYLSIDGKVLCFNHITKRGQIIDPLMPPLESNKTMGGELAFEKPRGLGYLIYPSSSLKNCNFIYGKYGVKWASSYQWASLAKDKVEEYILDIKPTIDNQEGKEHYFSIVREADLKNSVKDKYGLIYSEDGKKLLKYRTNLLHKKKDLSIKQNVDIICDVAFLKKKIDKIEIPLSLKCIGHEAFFSSKLKSINLHDNISIIKNGAFAFCTSLNSIEVPKSIHLISAHLFEGCSNLENIILHENILSIGSYAFSGCSKLKHISLPKHLETIGSSAFESCRSLISIEFPEHVSTINSYSFSFCSSIDKLSLANVIRIENEGFSFCSSLKYVEITESVSYIGTHAFLGCESLKTVCFNSQDIFVNEDAFERCNNLACLFIPKGSKTKFEEMLPQYSVILIER